MQGSTPSDRRLLLKLSAITWTIRPEVHRQHLACLKTRAFLVLSGQPAPGDTKEVLIRLFKRATSELPWPALPTETGDLFSDYLGALAFVDQMGEPEAAVEILSRHVGEIERRLIAPNHVARFYIYRLDWLLAAGEKFEKDEGKRGAYVAEAKG
jgi:hypothetical protein